MNYKPQCDSCKNFITTDKSIIKHIGLSFNKYLDVGRCKLSYCVKEKKQVYRKNMR